MARLMGMNPLHVATRYRVAQAFLKRAFTYAEALKLLDFDPGSSPTEAEVMATYRAKVRAILKEDPDAAKDQDALKPYNMAKDTLTGQLTPDRDPHAPSPNDGGGTTDVDFSGFGRQDRPAPEPVRVTFDDAMRDAGVHQVDWKFKTTTAYGGYGDTQSSAFVIYGMAGDTHVFVAVEHYTSRNPFTKEDVDTWWMKQQKAHGELRAVAPRVIRELWDEFPNVRKKYNAKVEILPADVKFTERLTHLHIKPVAFKDAMALMGNLAEDDPWQNRKKTIEFVIKDDRPMDIEIIVNGKAYNLRPENSERLKSKRIIDKIFKGGYYYAQSKKLLTRIQGGKEIMAWMAKNLAGEPPELIAALEAAAAQ